ncbi:unnamed protein product [Prorocentrum cordatum]|uniref:Uncharacterized protein n=1 Tax=Prorocentrum cordatum TaxID=2364126 RepID=A0ABN9W502_9DINO|nr:unnamed protein product [Polarella glacialis]
MDMLGLGRDLFPEQKGRLRTQGANRIKAMRAFFCHPQTSSDLRKASLCLQLSHHAVSMASQSKPKVDDPRPHFVRIAQGDIQKHTGEHLRRLLPLLCVDEKLVVPACLTALLVTQAHIVMRFDMYGRFPGKLWMMSRRRNPMGYSRKCEEFLQVPDDDLDLGYSLALKREAWRCRSLSDAAMWLMADEVQEEIDKVLGSMLANSLDAERKIHQDRAPDHAKARSLAVASRNQLLHQYHVERERFLACRMRAARQASSLKRCNIWSLARQRWPHLVPRPRGCRCGDDPLRDGVLSSTLVHEGDKDALRSQVEAHTADLEAEVAARQGEAARLARLANAAHVPVAQRDWLEWLDTNDGFFRHCLREAPVERQQFSRRVTPREGLTAVARLGPKITKEPPLWERKIAHLPSGYAMLLWQRGASEHKVLCFFCCLNGECRYLPLLNSRPGCNEYFLPAHTDYVAGFLGAACLAKTRNVPHDDAAVRVYTCGIDAKVAPDGMAIKCVAPLLEHRAPVVVPRAQADAGAADAGDAAVGDGSDCESLLLKMEGGAEEEAEELVHDLDEQGADDDGDDKEGADGGSPSDRALPGTWTLFNNGYFTLSENPVKYGDMKMR